MGLFLLILFITIIITSIPFIAQLNASNGQLVKNLEPLRKRFNLEINRSSKFSPHLYGSIQGRRVKISCETFDKSEYITVSMAINMNFKCSFKITSETLISKIKNAAGLADIKTCDDVFDSKMHLTSDREDNIISILNNKARKDILELTFCTSLFEISDDGLKIRVPVRYFSDSHTAMFIIEKALSICNNFSGIKSVQQGLIKNIKQNKENHQIRLNNLMLLAKNYSDENEIQKYLSSLFNDEDIGIQIEAAKYQKEKGPEHLLEILKYQWRIGKVFNPEVIDCLGEYGFKNAIPLLKEIYGKSETECLKIKILEAFKNLADESLSGFLVKELNNGNQKIRDCVIKALGACGKREAVEPLYKLNRSVRNSDVKNLIQEAISKIQTRLGPVDMGALSVAEQTGEDGALSITDNSVQGGLSMPDEKDKNKKLQQEEGGV